MISVLDDSFEALQQSDVDAYMERLDFGAPLDSAFYSVCTEAVRQQMQHEGHEQQIVSWRIPKVDIQSDSVAMAFYTLYLANGDSLCKGQLMVKTNGKWKLRVRD